MRVRVHFRYRADTGEVEIFRVDDAGGTPVGTDHDRRHERAALDVARVVDRDPLIEEIVDTAGPVDERVAAPAPDAEATGRSRAERIRE
jgi:FtsH ternary system domain X3